MPTYSEFVQSLESVPGELIAGEKFEEIAVIAQRLGSLVGAYKKQLFYRCENDEDGVVVAQNARLLHAALGKIDEACELFARVYEDIGEGGDDEEEPDRTNWLEELGDDRFFTQIALDVLGFTMQQVEDANEKKLRLRHGSSFNPDNAETRDRLAERAVLEQATA